ncbi:MAG: hypothetical protein JSV62_14135 [Promethearchaeota archaeon]|nr:MAG: hypothetical protein JSV62_14135 [Candidatus Lokiarchaeota archaeon]
MEFVKGKLRYGPYVGLLGSILLIIYSSWAYVEILQGLLDLEIYGVNIIMTFLIGILAFIGATIVLIGIKYGKIIMLIIGVVAVIGAFTPINTIIWGEGEQPFRSIWLVGSLIGTFIIFPIDPVLILIGGFLSFKIKEE